MSATCACTVALCIILSWSCSCTVNDSTHLRCQSYGCESGWFIRLLAAGVVVIEERPELEAQRNGLVMQSVDNQHRLLEIENRILEVCLVTVAFQYAHTCVRKCFG